MTPPEVDDWVEPSPVTLLVFRAWRWVSRHRPPPSIGFAGAVHSPIPSYWFDHWLEKKAGLVDGERFWRLLWRLLEAMDSMYLEHYNRPPGDEKGEDPKPG